MDTSLVGVSSRADFFKELPREIVWKPGSGRYLEISPKHNVTGDLSLGGPIIFNFPYAPRSAYNFSQSYLKFKLRIHTRNGRAPGENNVYGANGIGHTLWKNIELFAAGIPLTNPFQPYGYKKIIEHLLTSEQNNENHDELWGYKKRPNRVGNNLDMDTNRVAEHFRDGNPLNNEDWVEFIIYPNLDFLTQNLMLYV